MEALQYLQYGKIISFFKAYNNLAVNFKIVWEKMKVFVHQSKKIIEVFDLSFS